MHRGLRFFGRSKHQRRRPRLSCDLQVFFGVFLSALLTGMPFYTPRKLSKEGNPAAHVAVPSVPGPNEIVIAQQTVKNEENARSHTRSIPCLKAISRRPNCCILRPVCHQHRGAEDLATIAPQGVSSASPPLTGFRGLSASLVLTT